jgi:hypothetical protein
LTPWVVKNPMILKIPFDTLFKVWYGKVTFEKRIGGKKMTNKLNSMRNWWWNNNHRKGFVHR